MPMPFIAKITYRLNDEGIYEENPIKINSGAVARLVSLGAITMLIDYPNINKVVVVIERS